MNDPANRCAIGPQEHPAAPGMLICDKHFTRIATTLRGIEDEAVHLDARPSLAVQPGNGSRGSLASERAPARLDVLAFLHPQTRRWTRDAEPRYTPPAAKRHGPWCLFCNHDTCTAWRAGRRRDLHDDEADAGSDRLMSVLGVLHGWAQLIREERDLALAPVVTVTGERDTITRHLDWCARQPFIDEMFAELHGLLKSLKALNGTLEVSVGRCDSLQPDASLCRGKVWHIMIPHDDGDDEPGFRCGTCRRVWTGTEAVRKRHALWLDEQERKALA